MDQSTKFITVLILFLTPIFLNAQFKVEGKVTNTSGEPLIFVSINLVGTNVGTNTDINGWFSITVPDTNAVLEITYIGFEKLKVRHLRPEKKLELILSESSMELSEVTVKSRKGRMIPRFRKKSQKIQDGISYERNAGIAYQKSTYETTEQGEGYDKINENNFQLAKQAPVSTFSIDVDAASYSNLRRYLKGGHLPPIDAVRIEEMINYFDYDYETPIGYEPFAVHTELSECPWNKDNQLLLVGLQGQKMDTKQLPSSNLVFLIDVSGSMGSPNKLPLVKSSLKMLVDEMRPEDKVAIVVYAGAAGAVLQPTSGYEKQKIKTAIDNLHSGGSTAGAAGIQLAYNLARKSFAEGGNNRVILATDGDFNVGVSDDKKLVELIEKEREGNIFLTVLGFGTGNYQDGKMQKLADKGNGNHYYIDSGKEAQKVLVNEFGGTLFTIAKDVKLQLEFNPSQVKGYRLIGYENRMLEKEDFDDDKKDAGELGAGHRVTALYEIIPNGVQSEFLAADETDLEAQLKTNFSGDELLQLRLRYKEPKGSKSKLQEHTVLSKSTKLSKTSDNFRFAASVAQFGLLLRNSKFKGTANFADAEKMAKGAKGSDLNGYRAELIELIRLAAKLQGS